MADVDRGQLILVTALAIAVTLVALVLLLNTVIYAENLATRGADVGGQDAIEYRGAVLDGIGQVVDAENRLDYDDPDNVRENVTAAVQRVDALMTRQQLRRAELVEITNVTRTEAITDGAKLSHPEDTGSFENRSDVGTWTLVSDVDRTRAFTFDINDSQLATDRSNAFRVVVDNGSEWSAYIYDNNNEITVAVDNESASLTDVCSTTEDEPRLDLTAGTLAGQPCPGLTFGEGVDGAYEIRFVNGQNAGGTYTLTVDANPDTDGAIRANLDGPASGTAPYYAYAVYDVTVDVRFQTDTLTYTDRLRIAPGEPS